MKKSVAHDIILALKAATGASITIDELELIDMLIKGAKRKRRSAKEQERASRIQAPESMTFSGIPVCRSNIRDVMISFAGRANRPAPVAEVDTTPQQVEGLAKPDTCTGLIDCVCTKCEADRKAYREEWAKANATADNCTHKPDCTCARCEFYRNSTAKAVKCRCLVCRSALLLARKQLTTITELTTFDRLHGNIHDEFIGHHDKETCLCLDCKQEREYS